MKKPKSWSGKFWSQSRMFHRHETAHATRLVRAIYDASLGSKSEA